MTTGQFLSVEARVRALSGTTDRMEAIKTIGLFLAGLEHGSVRAATRDADGIWSVAPWCCKIICTNDRPKPMPALKPAYRALLRLVEKFGSVQWSRVSAVMPMPLS